MRRHTLSFVLIGVAYRIHASSDARVKSLTNCELFLQNNPAACIVYFILLLWPFACMNLRNRSWAISDSAVYWSFFLFNIEPGYVTTPVCMVQSAYVLLKEREKLPKGYAQMLLQFETIGVGYESRHWADINYRKHSCHYQSMLRCN